MRWIRRILFSALISILIYTGVALLLVAFGTSRPPPALPLITAPFAAIDSSALPSIRHYRARDGAPLSYRRYDGGAANFAVLIHGSAGSSVDMHPLATLLRAQGYTVYVPDVRGHGENRPHGDVGYLGQLDDDMEDLMETVSRDAAAGHWALVGFSSGGGFALRVAAEERIARYFQQVVLLAPYLRYDAPSVRQEPKDPSRSDRGPSTAAAVTATPWASASTGRIIGLVMIDRLGVHALDGLPVIAFAVPDGTYTTRTYSWRMQQNFGAHNDYVADIRALPAATRVLVGTQDSILIPAALRREFQSVHPLLTVLCVTGAGHSELVTTPKALEATVDTLIGRLDDGSLAACE